MLRVDGGVSQGDNVFLELSTANQNGRHLSFDVASKPLGSTFYDAGDGTAEFRWIPSQTDEGITNLDFSVTDGVSTDKKSAAITVDCVTLMPYRTWYNKPACYVSNIVVDGTNTYQCTSANCRSKAIIGPSRIRDSSNEKVEK